MENTPIGKYVQRCEIQQYGRLLTYLLIWVGARDTCVSKKGAMLHKANLFRSKNIGVVTIIGQLFKIVQTSNQNVC